LTKTSPRVKEIALS